MEGGATLWDEDFYQEREQLAGIFPRHITKEGRGNKSALRERPQGFVLQAGYAEAQAVAGGAHCAAAGRGRAWRDAGGLVSSAQSCLMLTYRGLTFLRWSRRAGSQNFLPETAFNSRTSVS